MEITFAVNGNNSFHKLELSKALLRFAEFDFTYFWEQCIETGRNARKTGRISPNLQALAVNALIKCHPYVEACINTEFSAVVLDCIIAYICHSEGIGLEELWARCISPKSLYEKSIFNRVSEYKTGRGINQWINIVRIQEYARSKMKFIYECESNVMLTAEEYRARREYFDLAFSVAANEIGCPMREMPCVRKYSPSSLPDSVFMMGRVSKNIYKRLSDVLSKADMWDGRKLNDHNRDQSALDAFSYVKDMPRPEIIDMNFALESICALPDTIYVPDSFKAIIDLEFSCMYENGIFLSKCPRCERYFVRSLDDKTPYCSRVTSSGMTCAEMINEELGIAAMKKGHIYEPPSDDAQEQPVNENEVSTPASAEPEPDEVSETISFAPPPPSPPPEPVNIEIPKDLEKRCQRVYNMVYKRVGRLMSSEEFTEWSKYLSDMKRDLRSGNAEFVQAEEFLDYWENAAKKQGKKGKNKLPDNLPVQNRTPIEPLAMPDVQDEPEQTTLSDFFDEAVKLAEDAPKQQPKAEKKTETENEKEFKPFTPPKYNTVLEAMLDGKYKSDELLDSGSTEDISDLTVNGKKVSLPNWERINREDL